MCNGGNAYRLLYENTFCLEKIRLGAEEGRFRGGYTEVGSCMRSVYRGRPCHDAGHEPSLYA